MKHYQLKIRRTIERVVREVEEEEERGRAELENDLKMNHQNKKTKKTKRRDIDTDDTLTQEKLIQTKEEIAELGSKLIEDPEENIVCLTRLRKMSESKIS